MPTSTTMTPLPYSSVSPNSTSNVGYITQITLPSGRQYEIVDEAGRQELTDLTININGVSTTVGALSTAVSSISSTVNGISSTVSAISTTVSALSNLTSYTKFLGVINTAVTPTLTDGSTASMVAIGTQNTAATTATTGAIVI